MTALPPAAAGTHAHTQPTHKHGPATPSPLGLAKVFRETNTRNAPTRCKCARHHARRDALHLFDGAGREVAATGWDSVEQGSARYRLPNGEYVSLPATAGVLDVLKAAGNFSIFLEALQVR